MQCGRCNHQMTMETCGFASVSDGDEQIYLCHADDHDCLRGYNHEQMAGAEDRVLGVPSLPPTMLETVPAEFQPSEAATAAVEQLQLQFPDIPVVLGPPVPLPDTPEGP
jgi:hypothetical protein